jgi:hypothetical protein
VSAVGQTRRGEADILASLARVLVEKVRTDPFASRRELSGSLLFSAVGSLTRRLVRRRQPLHLLASSGPFLGVISALAVSHNF